MPNPGPNEQRFDIPEAALAVNPSPAPPALLVPGGWRIEGLPGPVRGLVERLRTEGLLRRLCGWEAAGGVPSEATFSRAFAEFAASDLPGRLHEALLDRTLAGHVSPEARRTRERSTVERVNGRLKDEFGGRHVRVRGPGKVWCHLMFGILALTVEQSMRLTL